MTGRHAVLPPGGYQSPQRLFVGEADGAVMVRVYTESGGLSYDFQFGDFPVGGELQIWFAQVFLASTGPAGAKRRLSSAQSGHGHLRNFARYLGDLSNPPRSPVELKPVHLDGYELQRRADKSWPHEICSVRGMLRTGQDTSAEFRRHLETWWTPARRGKPPKARYSEQEFDQYLAAARADIRQAALRIRGARQFLTRWRSGPIDQADARQWERGWLLDYIDRHGDVPRYVSPSGRLVPTRLVIVHGGSNAVMAQLFPTVLEAGAAAVLLMGVTGQNLMTLSETTVSHHRPDGHSGGPATAITDMVKYRRGPRTASMSVPLTDLPPWVPAPASAGDPQARRSELHTPFGVFMLLAEIMAGARGHAPSDRLVACWSGKFGKGFRVGLPNHWGNDWAISRGLPGFNSLAMRAAWVEIHQQPVAHTETTLVNEYLARRGGDLTTYRKVVAEVLETEVTKARTLQRIKVLSEADLAEARDSPGTVARRFGLDATTLKRVLAGELDTVFAACIDNLAGQFSPPGQPCRASFMMCLSCPCARATPAHLPVLIAARDMLLSRQAEMTPLRWAERFAGPVAQLDDVLSRFPESTIQAHRAAITAEQRDLVSRFLNRELDLR